MVEALADSQHNQMPVYSPTYKKRVSEQDSLFLEQRLQEAKDKQGFLGTFWNGIKEATDLGLSSSDCESKLQEYKNGKISFEEAVEYIESFENKQKNMSGLFSNILTGIGAIATATASIGLGPIGWGLAIAKGAPIGALIKTGINMLDRATNNVDNDVLNAKQIAKDAISGAMTGAASAVSSGIGAGIKSGKIGVSILNGAKCGAICGGASGALSYMTDAVFEDDIKFNIKDLVKNSATSAFVSGTVGGAIGAGVYGSANIAGTIGQETTKTMGQTIVTDSTLSSLRKVVANAEQNLISPQRA